MRVWGIMILLLAAGCQQQAALSYEGVDYKTEAAKVAHGKRLATVLDCTGCHGSDFQGTNLNAEDPKKDAMHAPNITLLLGRYSDAELDRLIRKGVPRDGRKLWFMPVESYQFLSDADFAALSAFLRTVTPAGRPRPPFRKDRDLEREIAEGLLGNAQQQIAKYRAQPPADLGPQHAWGRYLAQTTCTQCHNNALQGWKDFTPDLHIAGAYTTAELETLLTTGKGKAKPDLGMMSEMGRRVFSRFTPSERAAVIAYVKARAERAN
jgi:mono/diheme cytochrome c family protein